MSEKLPIFTSTGKKILRQGDTLSQWKQGKPVPVSLQLALTENCTLNCKFCSVVNRPKKYVFDYNNLIEATDKFIALGIKTIEMTGGGDPLLYPQLNEYLEHLSTKKIKLGLITNGIGINKKIDKKLLNNFDWIRISSNVLDYRDTIDIPENFKGTLGFSYCWTEDLSTIDQLSRIKDIALKNNVKYIRLVPNCLSTIEEQKEKNRVLSKIAEEFGEPLFFQPKIFEAPSNCYWGYMKPFLYCDEYIYPCSSTILNPDADKQFNTSYRWGHYSEIDNIWQPSKIQSILDAKKCSHCVFTEQNKMMEYALTPQEHEDFI